MSTKSLLSVDCAACGRRLLLLRQLHSIVCACGRRVVPPHGERADDRAPIASVPARLT